MTRSNADQNAYWSGVSGRKWVLHDAWLTTQFAPVAALLVARSRIGPGDRVLDIGCGTGFITRAAAARAGPDGRVTGIDFSAPMIEEARRLSVRVKTGRIDHVEADAQVHDFGAHRFDRIISQFGVMFFSDPVAAFANILQAARPGAQMTLACWGALAENPLFHLPKTVGESFLAPLASEPGAPSPTAFADRDMVCDLLESAGWANVSADPVALELTPPGGVSEIADMALRIGPVARLVQHHEADEGTVAQIAAALRGPLAAYESSAGLRIPALINVFAAMAPG